MATRQQRYKDRKAAAGYQRADIHLPKEIMAWVDREKGERSRSEFIAEKLDAAKAPAGNVIYMGDLEDVGSVDRALVIQFAKHDDLRDAIKAQRCRFTVFGG